MKLYRLLACSLLFVANSQISFADVSDHVANAETVDILINAVSDDADEKGNKLIKVSIKNKLRVALVLRGISTPAGKGEIMKKSKVFGATVWRDIDLLNISPNSTKSLNGNTFKILLPAKSYATGLELEFDFGPKGELYATLP